MRGRRQEEKGERRYQKRQEARGDERRAGDRRMREAIFRGKRQGSNPKPRNK
jgi:hypothetical protein